MLVKDKIVSLDAKVTSFSQPAEVDPSNEWYREGSMGNTTMMGFSLMKEQQDDDVKKRYKDLINKEET